VFGTSILFAAMENFVLFSTVFAVAMFAVALIVRQITIRELWQPKAASLARYYAAALLVPPAASLWLVAAALLPRLWLTPEVFAAEHSTPHQFHLFGELAIAVEPALAYAMASFLIVTAAVVVWFNVRASWRIGNVVEKLDMHAAAPPTEQVAVVNEVAARAGLSVGLVMSDYPLSFVWGFRHSKLILSSGLLRTLTGAELTGVLEHEAAHHERRDNLIKLLLSLCSYSSLAFPLSRLMVGWRATEVEILCDEVAAARTSEPLEIAEALVKLRRQTMVGPLIVEPIPTHATASSFVSDSALTFQRRVARLLTLVDAPALLPSGRPSNLARISALLFTASIVTLSGILLFAPLSVHHAAESLIGISK
jgi:Zn-dependent protease with chaperone function